MNLLRTNWLAVLCFVVAAMLLIASSPGLQAQHDSARELAKQNQISKGEPIPRDQFLSLDTLPDPLQELSNDLLLKALDSEAFYTFAGQLKPVSEGFWGGYFSVDPADLTELEQVRTAVRAWNVPEIFFADVLVYESVQNGQRYASAYLVHIPSLRELIQQEKEFFARWGITPASSPHEVMMSIEKSRRPDDRWRGFGLVFGYPRYAVDFFVNAGMHQRNTGEFVERDFRHIPTFSGRTGRFVYAVPKLSQVGSDDIDLQRRAAALLPEYKRLRPKYVASSKKPVELLRDWMDDGTGHCHPDYLLAKLPTRTDAEIDAEIASWSTPEPRSPEVKFNHLYMVLNQSDFDALRSSEFFVNQFAATDQGLPTFLPVDEASQSIYVRGQETYLEFLGPENKFREPVGKIGLGWSVEKIGELDRVQDRLGTSDADRFTRVLNKWDFDREGSVPWYHALYRKDMEQKDTVWWFSETHVNFIPALYGDGQSVQDPEAREQIARRDFLRSRFDADRILKNITSLRLELPQSIASLLRADLEQIGFRSEEFDARTWVLKGTDFRLMISVNPDGTPSRIASIGFDTTPHTFEDKEISVGERVDVILREKKSGSIEFK